jgi:hypothetical protein
MGGVWIIYQNVLPPVADIRVGQNNDKDAAAAEKTARWTAAVVVAGVSLLTQDMTVFILGASALIAESWAHRHANAWDSSGQGIVVPPPRQNGFMGSLSVKASAGV